MGRRLHALRGGIHQIIHRLRARPWRNGSMAVGLMLLSLGTMQALRRPSPPAVSPHAQTVESSESASAPRTVPAGRPEPESAVEHALFELAADVADDAGGAHVPTVEPASVELAAAGPASAETDESRAEAESDSPPQPPLYPHRPEGQGRGAWLAGTIEELPEPEAPSGPADIDLP